MWTKKSAIFVGLSVVFYLAGLVLRNYQLIYTGVILVAYVVVSAYSSGHGDVSAAGQSRSKDEEEEGVTLGKLEAFRRLSTERIFEDGEVDIDLKIVNKARTAKILEVRDKVPEVMRMKRGSNYILMELGPRRETVISYTLESPLRGFYSLGPVNIRAQDAFGLFHTEREVHLYSDFLVFPKVEDIKEAFVKSKVPKIFTGAQNIRQPGPGSEFYSLREYVIGDAFKDINWNAYARTGKLMVNEKERDAVSDIIIIVDSRAVSEVGPVARNALVYSTRAAASLASFFLSRRDSVGLVLYGDEILSVDRDTGNKQLYVVLTKLAGAVARGHTPLKIVTDRLMPTISKGSPIVILSNLEDDNTIVEAVRDFRARDFDVTILAPSSLEFEFDARKIDRMTFDVLKMERDVRISELRAFGAKIIDWHPDMLLNTALAGARGF